MSEATPPGEIWLQWIAGDVIPAFDISWCQDKINETDVRYVHEFWEADANQLAEALEAIVQGLGGLAILPLGLTRRMVDAACKALDKHKERGGG